MQRAEIRVTATWDDVAGVWVATSVDLPGLVAEAATEEALIEQLQEMIPDLIATSESLGLETPDFPPEVPLIVSTQRESLVRLRA